MPYIIQSQRSLEYHGAENVLIAAAEAFRLLDDATEKSQSIRNFLAYVIDGVYGEESFAHSQAMSSMVNPGLLPNANMLVANIAGIHGEHGGREGLLNYMLTRFFNEAYPSPRYKDFNAVAGILTSLANMGHPGNIELLGMLICCRDEYYRKRAAPYEDQKERENGQIHRLDSPTPTSY